MNADNCSSTGFPKEHTFKRQCPESVMKNRCGHNFCVLASWKAILPSPLWKQSNSNSAPALTHECNGIKPGHCEETSPTKSHVYDACARPGNPIGKVTIYKLRCLADEMPLKFANDLCHTMWRDMPAGSRARAFNC